jgi:hypothetical protein
MCFLPFFVAINFATLLNYTRYFLKGTGYFFGNKEASPISCRDLIYQTHLIGKKQDLTPLTNVEFHAKVTIDITHVEKIEEVANNLRQLISQTDLLL